MNKTQASTRAAFQGTFQDLLNSDLQLIVSLLKSGDVSFTDKQYRDCIYSKFAGGFAYDTKGAGAMGEKPPDKFNNWQSLFWYLYESRFLPLHTTPILLYISRDGCPPCMRFNAIWEQLKNNKVIKNSVRCVKIQLKGNLKDLHPILADSILQLIPPESFGTPSLMCVEPRSFFSIFTCSDLVPFQVKDHPGVFYVREVYDYQPDDNIPQDFTLRMIPYGYVKNGEHYKVSNTMIFEFQAIYQWINDVKYDTIILNEQAEHEALIGSKTEGVNKHPDKHSKGKHLGKSKHRHKSIAYMSF